MRALKTVNLTKLILITFLITELLVSCLFDSTSSEGTVVDPVAPETFEEALDGLVETVNADYA